ncbi:MAG: magnesium transporter [Patescibacteria group bacterium]|jgi:magnesium transporter
MHGGIRSLMRGHLDRKQRLLRRVPTALAHETVETVRGRIERTRNWDSVNYIYVLDQKKRLKGTVSIKELLRASHIEKIGQIAIKEPIAVRPTTSLERTAILAIHHSIKCVPVTDSDGVFLGVIGTDTILRTLQHAGIDDAIRHAGIHLEQKGLLNVLHGKIFFLTKRRLPWLLLGLAGGLTSSLLVSRFEGYLREVVELAFFSPAIVYMGDAVGTQTQALFMRAITIGEVRVSKFLFREVSVNAIIGAIVGILSFGAVYLFLSDSIIAWIVGLSMFLTVSVSGAVATTMTVVLAARKNDPALGAGPFATVIQDVVSLMIYFGVAALILTCAKLVG